MLTRILRHHGTMKGILTTGNERVEELKERLDAIRLMTRPSCAHIYEERYSPARAKENVSCWSITARKAVLCASLTKRGCDVVVVPHDTTAEEIRRLASGRHPAVQWPWGPEGCSACGKNDSRAARRISDLRHLPGSPAVRSGMRRGYGEAEVRPSRRQPSGEGAGNEPLLHHFPEPWLHGC